MAHFVFPISAYINFLAMAKRCKQHFILKCVNNVMHCCENAIVPHQAVPQYHSSIQIFIFFSANEVLIQGIDQTTSQWATNALL